MHEANQELSLYKVNVLMSTSDGPIYKHEINGFSESKDWITILADMDVKLSDVFKLVSGNSFHVLVDDTQLIDKIWGGERPFMNCTVKTEFTVGNFKVNMVYEFDVAAKVSDIQSPQFFRMSKKAQGKASARLVL